MQDLQGNADTQDIQDNADTQDLQDNADTQDLEDQQDNLTSSPEHRQILSNGQSLSKMPLFILYFF